MKASGDFSLSRFYAHKSIITLYLHSLMRWSQLPEFEITALQIYLNEENFSIYLARKLAFSSVTYMHQMKLIGDYFSFRSAMQKLHNNLSYYYYVVRFSEAILLKITAPQVGEAVSQGILLYTKD